MGNSDARHINHLCYMYECQSPEHLARNCPLRLEQGTTLAENLEPSAVVNRIRCVTWSPNNKPEQPCFDPQRKWNGVFTATGGPPGAPQSASGSTLAWVLPSTNAEVAQEDKTKEKRLTNQRKRYVTIQVGYQDVSPDGSLIRDNYRWESALYWLFKFGLVAIKKLTIN